MSRLPVAVSLLLLALGVAGCGKEHDHLIASGKIVSGTIWEKPPALGALGENDGFSLPKDSRVEIYPNLIIVTTSDGVSHVGPTGSYTNLAFTPD